MTRHSSKSNKLSNVKVELGTSPSKTGKFTMTESKLSRFTQILNETNPFEICKS